MTLRRYITDFVGDKGTGTWEGNRLQASGFWLQAPSSHVVRRTSDGRQRLSAVSRLVGDPQHFFGTHVVETSPSVKPVVYLDFSYDARRTTKFVLKPET